MSNEVNPNVLLDAVKQLSLDLSVLKSEFSAFKNKQLDENLNFIRQIERRPVDMTQMRDQLYDDVNKQIEWRLSQKISEFDGVVNTFFANARFTPNGKVSEQFDTNIKVDKGEKS